MKPKPQVDWLHKKLSLNQRNLQLYIDEINDLIKEKELRKALDNHLREKGRPKNDSTRMFLAIKHMQWLNPKISLLVEADAGDLTENKYEQLKLI